MASSLTLDPAMIRHVVLQILQKWARQGGTRLRLLEIAKAFHLNDAAEQIATAISQHPGFPDPFTHATIDYDGGDLKLDDLGIRVSIPSGAISKGMRSVATLCVPRSNSFNIPLDDGEVLVTHIVRCSFSQELRKPAAVTLPHCIIPERYQQKKEDLCLKLYTKPGQGNVE
nr:netrin receptor UNC5C-like [Lytechinus pictus]